MSACGTIPAPAGKPYISVYTGSSTGDYPRACGETLFSRSVDDTIEGLSPRLRGNPKPPVSLRLSFGTIPAPAGKPDPQNPAGRRYWDYPRACGETAHHRWRRRPMSGLSPRLRGNRSTWPGTAPCCGTIPAPAGKPNCPLLRDRSLGDYPRACGETVTMLPWPASHSGLSPRLRGNRDRLILPAVAGGTIPAPAGKPVVDPGRCELHRDYPRACGETVLASGDSTDRKGLSPRLRGNQTSPCGTNSVDGTIPAPAGKPTTARFRK